MKTILNIPSISGIYAIKNTITNQLYIGSSVNIKKRCNAHRSNLLNNKHANIYLQRSFDKYGAGSFYFYVIEETNDLLSKEQYYIDTLKPQFNLRLLADSNRGIELSDLTRQRMSQAHKGKPLSFARQMALDKLHKNRVGKLLTDKAKQSLELGPKSKIGKPVSEDTKRKIRQAKLGKPSKLKGTKLTQEHKDKISRTKKGNAVVPQIPEILGRMILEVENSN